jgi:hypothetical protein
MFGPNNGLNGDVRYSSFLHCSEPLSGRQEYQISCHLSNKIIVILIQMANTIWSFNFSFIWWLYFPCIIVSFYFFTRQKITKQPKQTNIHIFKILCLLTRVSHIKKIGIVLSNPLSKFKIKGFVWNGGMWRSGMKWCKVMLHCLDF